MGEGVMVDVEADRGRGGMMIPCCLCLSLFT
jgi:hypothetical protein